MILNKHHIIIPKAVTHEDMAESKLYGSNYLIVLTKYAQRVFNINNHNNILSIGHYQHSSISLAPAFNILTFFNVFSLDISFTDSPANIDNFAKLIIISSANTKFRKLSAFVKHYNITHKRINLNLHWLKSHSSPTSKI